MCMFCSYWHQMIGGMGFGLAAILSSSPLAHLIIKQFASGSSGVSKHHENTNAAFQELWQASQERLRSVLLGSHEIEEKYLLQIGKIFQSFAGLSWCRSCFRWSLCPDILTSSRALSAMQIQTLPFLGDACLLYIIYIYIFGYIYIWVLGYTVACMPRQHQGLYLLFFKVWTKDMLTGWPRWHEIGIDSHLWSQITFNLITVVVSAAESDVFLEVSLCWLRVVSHPFQYFFTLTNRHFLWGFHALVVPQAPPYLWSFCGLAMTPSTSKHYGQCVEVIKIPCRLFGSTFLFSVSRRNSHTPFRQTLCDHPNLLSGAISWRWWCHLQLLPCWVAAWVYGRHGCQWMLRRIRSPPDLDPSLAEEAWTFSELLEPLALIPQYIVCYRVAGWPVDRNWRRYVLLSSQNTFSWKVCWMPGNKGSTRSSDLCSCGGRLQVWTWWLQNSLSGVDFEVGPVIHRIHDLQKCCLTLVAQVHWIRALYVCNWIYKVRWCCLVEDKGFVHQFVSLLFTMTWWQSGGKPDLDPIL